MCFRPNDVSANDQPLLCPACSRENAPGEARCVFCGADLAPAPATPAPPAQAPVAPGAPKPPAAPSGPAS